MMPADPPTRPPVPLDRIEAAAEDATEGPWELDERDLVIGGGELGMADVASVFVRPDADLIVLCDPPTIKALTAAARDGYETLVKIRDEGCSCPGKDHESYCHVAFATCAIARLDAAVSFSPTGGAEDG